MAHKGPSCWQSHRSSKNSNSNITSEQQQSQSPSPPLQPEVSSVITAADARGLPTESSRKFFSIVLDPTLGRTPLSVHHDFPARQTQVATQMLVSVAHLPPATKTVKNKKTVVASPLNQVDEDIGITA
jgi:hypothetical protein